MKIIEDISYGNHKNNVLDLYLTEKENSPVFIYFHGGGLEHGSYKHAKSLMQRLVQNGINTISAEYRMYPDAKFPDYLTDAANAILWVKKNLKNYTSHSDIYVGGSSAGGYITQMLCFDKKYLAEVGLKTDDISGFIHDAGQPTTHFNVLRERGFSTEHGGTERRVVVDQAAPIYHINGTEKYPPMLFFVSDHDMPNRYEQTMLLLSVMKNYDYDMDKVQLEVMENSRHCSYINQTDENGKNPFTDIICGFIQKTKAQ